MSVYVGDELFYKGVEISMQDTLWGLCTLFVLLVFSLLLRRYALRWVFGVLLFLFCFFGGLSCTMHQLQETTVAFADKETIYRVCITEKPQVKEKSMLCTAELDGKNILLYLTKDSLSQRLRSGDELLIKSRLSVPAGYGNPDEFDYPRYLLRRRISGVGFCSSGNWKLLAHHRPLSLSQRALVWRERVLGLYHELGFRGDELAVLSALTVGYKEELSEEIRESYSISGASHVLALSGLHIGFLYALLLFGLRIFPDRWWGARLCRCLIIITLLWAFAFFTGLSPSVVRSVLMCSLLVLSSIWGRESFSINTLAIAAFFMLLCRPSWLFDVGFQLSFCAVAAILLLQPDIYKILSPTHRMVRPVWTLLSVSLAAQIGTAPLVMLYFGRFSTHFLLTNLLVIVLVSVIMYGAVVMLLLTPFSLFQGWVAWLVKMLLQWLNAIVRWIEQLPLASIDQLWIYPFEAFLFYLFICLGRYCVSSHRAKSLLACLFCLLLLWGGHAFMRFQDRPVQSLSFYHVRGCPAVHCVAVDGRSWLVYADSLPDEKRLHRVASRHWQRQRLPQPRAVTADYQDSTLCFRDRILSYSGRRVCMVNDDRWKYQSASQPLAVDYLYVCKGYNGRLHTLAALFSFSTIILDASLPSYQQDAFKEECMERGYHFIALSEKGSMRFLL